MPTKRKNSAQLLSEQVVNDHKNPRDEGAVSECDYKELVEALSDWVWTIDTHARFMYSSPALHKILGYTEEEVIGKNAFDFALPEDRVSLIETFNDTVARRNKTIGCVLRFVSKSGQIRYLEINAKSIFDFENNLIGYHGAAHDITERTEAQEKLMRSEQSFRAIFNYVPAVIYAYDRNGVITQANAASEHTLGFTVEYLVGRSLYDTIARPEDRAEREAVIARVFAGEVIDNIQWEERCADGSTVLVLSNAAPIFNAEEKVIMGLDLGMDITQLKKAEQKSRELETHMREFYKRTILAATCGKLAISSHEEIEQLVGMPLASWCIKNEEHLSSIREEVAQAAKSFGMEESKIEDLVLCAGEATSNSLKHDSGGHASLHKMPEALVFVMSDHGTGIDVLALPHVALTRGYTTAISLGMGYKTMISIADAVYLATGPLGTTVALQVALHRAKEPSALSCLTDVW
ncbi:MAG: PAS domain S-box protein [Armatimonadota bacterium]